MSRLRSMRLVGESREERGEGSKKKKRIEEAPEVRFVRREHEL